MVACDFFTVETVWLKRIYVLVFIELATRRVHLAGCTTNPDGAWVAQQARNFTFHLDEREEPLQFLIHDRDAKFCGSFDEIFTAEGLQVVRTPVRAPRANAFCERWIRTVRTECLDWLLIFSRRHLERVLKVYIRHYNRQRPHRGLHLQQPEQEEFEKTSLPVDARVCRRDDLAGCCTNIIGRQHDGTEFVHPSPLCSCRRFTGNIRTHVNRESLLLNEFAWDKMDEATAGWYLSQVDKPAPEDVSLLPDNFPEMWIAEHEGLHTSVSMRETLDKRFHLRSFEWVPYVARYYLQRDDLVAQEAHLIKHGHINGVGFRYVGNRT